MGGEDLNDIYGNPFAVLSLPQILFPLAVIILAVVLMETCNDKISDINFSEKQEETSKSNRRREKMIRGFEGPILFVAWLIPAICVFLPESFSFTIDSILILALVIIIIDLKHC